MKRPLKISDKHLTKIINESIKKTLEEIINPFDDGLGGVDTTMASLYPNKSIGQTWMTKANSMNGGGQNRANAAAPMANNANAAGVKNEEVDSFGSTIEESAAMPEKYSRIFKNRIRQACHMGPSAMRDTVSEFYRQFGKNLGGISLDDLKDMADKIEREEKSGLHIIKTDPWDDPYDSDPDDENSDSFLDEGVSKSINRIVAESIKKVLKEDRGSDFTMNWLNNFEKCSQELMKMKNEVWKENGGKNTPLLELAFNLYKLCSSAKDMMNRA